MFVVNQYIQRFDGWTLAIVLGCFVMSFASGVAIARVFFGEDWAGVKRDNDALTKENKKLLKKTTKQEIQITELQDQVNKLRLTRDELTVWMQSNPIDVIIS